MSFPFPINPVDGQTVSHITANGDLLKATYDASKNNWNIERAVKPAALTLAKSGASIPTATADKQVMMWDQTANQWVASSISLKTTDLGDVDGTVTPADQYFLLFDAGLNKYVPKPLTGGSVLTATTVGLNAKITTAGSLDAGLTALFKAEKPLSNPKGGDAYVITAVAGNSALDNLAGTYLYSGTAWVKATSEGGGAAAQYRPTSTDVQKPGKNIGDLDILTELNNHQLNVFDGGTFQTVFSEVAIKQWIAAGSLFQGTLKTDADLAGLPAAGVANRGFYWTWTGNASHAITAPVTATLQVGDWLQSDGTKYIHVPSDLMSKQRWESVGSFRTWADGSYEVSTLVYHKNSLWKATSTINLGDTEPGVNANWQEIAIRSSLEDLTNVNDNVSVYGEDCVLVWDETNHEWTASRSMEIDDITFDASGPGTLLSGIAARSLTVSPGANEAEWAASVAAVKGAITSLNFDDLADTKGLSAATDGQVPKWDATNNVWKPAKLTIASLADVGDVNIAAIPNNGEALVWDGTSNRWVPKQSASSMATLTDVDLTTAAPTDGQHLKWDATGSKWIPTNINLGDLGDTTLSTPAKGNLLQFDDTTSKWVNWVPDYLSPTNGYTKTEVDNKITAVVTGLVHFEAVLSRADTPPASPATNDLYIVGPTPTGAWVGKNNQLARWTGTAWAFEVPRDNESHLVEDVAETWHWNGIDWVKVAVATTTGGPAAAGDLWMVGAIQQSMLNEAQFKALLSVPEQNKWVLADGRNVSGTKYATATGQSSVPDLRGAFLRMAGQNASNTAWNGSSLNTFYEDTTRRPRTTAFTTDSQGSHNHLSGVPIWTDEACFYGYQDGLVPSKRLANYDGNSGRVARTNSNGAHTHTITGGDSESAPKHYSVNYFIKVN